MKIKQCVRVAIVFFVSAYISCLLVACDGKQTLPHTGPMPTHDGSLTRYAEIEKKWSHRRTQIFWKNESGEFLKPSDRLEQIARSGTAFYNKFKEGLAAQNRKEEALNHIDTSVSVMPVVISLNPDIVILSMNDETRKKPNIPFKKWRLAFGHTQNHSVVRTLSIGESPSGGWPLRVGEIFPVTDYVFAVDLIGGKRKIELENVGDSVEIYSDDEAVIKLQLMSPETIRCFRVNKGDDTEGGAPPGGVNGVESMGSGLD